MRHRPIAPWVSPLSVLACVMSVVAAPAGAQDAPATASFCRPAPHPEYGRSAAHPIQVGGGPMYGSARQRRFLDSLTGPRGQPVRYERNVSTSTAPDGTLVDSYAVTYDGLDTPVTLVLDWYHVTEQFAPAGFACGRDPELGTPPPDPFVGREQLHALAAEIAAAPGFRPGPVDLGRGGDAGFVIDEFRVRSRRQRSATAAPPAEAPGTIVVAYPRQCGGRAVSPSRIALVGPQGDAADAAATLTDRKAIQALVPGQDVPDGSLAATFALDALLAGLQVRVSFPSGPCADAAEVTPGLRYGRASLLESPMPARPADDTSGVQWVAVQAVVGHDGGFHQRRPLGGPAALERAAVAALDAWRAEPARVNGAPLATPVVLRVDFAPTPR